MFLSGTPYGTACILSCTLTHIVIRRISTNALDLIDKYHMRHMRIYLFPTTKFLYRLAQRTVRDRRIHEPGKIVLRLVPWQNSIQGRKCTTSSNAMCRKPKIHFRSITKKIQRALYPSREKFVFPPIVTRLELLKMQIILIRSCPHSILLHCPQHQTVWSSALSRPFSHLALLRLQLRAHSAPPAYRASSLRPWSQHSLRIAY